MIKKALILTLIILAFALPCYAQGVKVFGSTDPPINLLTNPDFGSWSHSTLAQNTTGVQSDFEYGSAIQDDDCEDDGTSSYILANCTLDPNVDSGAGAGGSDGYYVVTQTAASQYCWFVCSGLKTGHDYKFSVYIKNGTYTLTTADHLIASNNIGTINYNFTYLANSAAWSDFSLIWRATQHNNVVWLGLLMGAGETIYIDEWKVQEVTPGCVGADTLAFDGWYKKNTAQFKVFREPNGTNTDGSYYGLKLVQGASFTDYLRWPLASISTAGWFVQQFQGRQVVLGAKVKTNKASAIRLRIYDGTTETYSAYHTGGNTFEWLETTAMISATASQVDVSVYSDPCAVTGYVCQPVFTYGFTINLDQYYPTNKTIYLEDDIASHKFDGSASVSDGSGVVYLGGDSSAKIPYGARAVKVRTSIKDTGSAGTDCYFRAGWDVSENIAEYLNSPFGRANNQNNYECEWIPLNADGNFEYTIEEATVMTISDFEYVAVEVR